MQELIEWGAVTDKGPGTGFMLQSALKNRDADVAEVLVNTLIKKAKSDGIKSDITALNDALHAVAEHGGSRRLMRHLEQAGADIDYVNANGKTPLMMAAKFGHISAVQWLVKHGARQETTDYGDHTALALAKRYKQTKIVNFLENSQPTE
jgi:ankyrin repeat protein